MKFRLATMNQRQSVATMIWLEFLTRKSPAREEVRRAACALKSPPGFGGFELIAFDAHINKIGI